MVKAAGIEDDARFDALVRRVEPSLRRALCRHLGANEVADAVAEAFAYAWAHRDHVLSMENPAGYLYRVAQSRSRVRRQGFLPWESDTTMPDIEPGLLDALTALPVAQQTAVWLVHGCGFSTADAAEAMGIKPSTVSTHLGRGLERLRLLLGVHHG
jgi:DNA-directed RNA polymerase specialized sigma24 family protein